MDLLTATIVLGVILVAFEADKAALVVCCAGIISNWLLLS